MLNMGGFNIFRKPFTDLGNVYANYPNSKADEPKKTDPQDQKYCPFKTPARCNSRCAFRGKSGCAFVTGEVPKTKDKTCCFTHIPCSAECAFFDADEGSCAMLTRKDREIRL